MTERGMIFNGEMVRAILDGRKMQTRRPLKWKQTRFTEIGEREDGSRWPWSEDAEHACDFWHPCPFGAVGGRIWVRETWARYNIDQDSHDMAYRATPPADWPEEGRWRPSIHMPRWASRILLEITDVRVEQLNDISEEDARSEGISGSSARDLKEAYAALWRSIYGSDSWRANPWVWVIEFKRIEGDGHATD
ncbi:ASCH domain-containing protein [Enterobacter cloacae]|uniref:hypothetical protein n=1 Tax=Enterobacter cloacae TaxID=550 RepID=UPI0021D86D38|nr:hypothetical protein [Enterobacter cloacae]MCU8695843.1 hypothetical protein [Enterobacter cloacae]